MNKLILAKMPLSMILLILILSSCSSNNMQQTSVEQPLVEYVKARTSDGNGIVVLVMRTWDSALSHEEIEEIKNSLQQELLEVWHGTIAETTLALEPDAPESRVLTFCYAVYPDKAPKELAISSTESEKGYEPVYRLAEQWFITELAGVAHPRGY